MEPCCSKIFRNRLKSIQLEKDLEKKMACEDAAIQKISKLANSNWRRRLMWRAWELFEVPTSSIAARVLILIWKFQLDRNY